MLLDPGGKAALLEKKRACLQSLMDALTKLKKHKFQSIAVAPISTGISGYPLALAVGTIA